jgi:hydrogenase maturation protease
MTDPKTSMVIGIGNPLRGDDGAGYRLARCLQSEERADLKVIATQQLHVELAASVAAAERVLFIDASHGLEPCGRWSSPHVEPLASRGPDWIAGSTLSHQLSPPALLELTKALYQHRPSAWQLLLPGQQWDHSEALSPLTAAAVAAAFPLIEAWSRGDA